MDAERANKKAFGDLIQPISKRIDNVSSFLLKIKQGIQYQVMPIQDDFGPTRHEANLDAIVGSVETAKGCQMGTWI